MAEVLACNLDFYLLILGTSGQLQTHPVFFTLSLHSMQMVYGI